MGGRRATKPGVAVEGLTDEQIAAKVAAWLSTNQVKVAEPGVAGETLVMPRGMEKGTDK